MEKSRLKDLALEKVSSVEIPKSKSQIAKEKREKVTLAPNIQFLFLMTLAFIARGNGRRGLVQFEVSNNDSGDRARLEDYSTSISRRSKEILQTAEDGPAQAFRG